MDYNNQNLPEFHIQKQEEEKKKKKRLLPWWFSGSAKTSGTLGSHGITGAGGLGVKATFGAKAGASFFATKMGMTVAAVALMAGAGIIGLAISKSMNKTTLEGPRMMTDVQNLASSDLGEAQRMTGAEMSKSSLELFAEGNKVAAENAAAANTMDDAAIEDAAIDDLITDAENPEMEPAQQMEAAPEMESAKQMPKAKLGGFGSIGGADSGMGFKGLKKAPALKQGKAVMGKFNKPNFNNVGGVKNQNQMRRQYKNVTTKQRGALGARGQMRAMNTRLAPTKNMTGIDQMAATVDRAWEGEISQGDGNLIVDGSEGIVGDGSFGLPDATTTPPGGHGGGGNYDGGGNITVPDVPVPDNPKNPWDWMVTTINVMLGIAGALLIVAGILSDFGKIPLFGAGAAAAALALLISIGAMVAGILTMALLLGTSHGQWDLAKGFLLQGGIFAGCVAAVAFTGASGAIAATTALTIGLGAVISSLAGIFGNMAKGG